MAAAAPYAVHQEEPRIEEAKEGDGEGIEVIDLSSDEEEMAAGVYEEEDEDEEEDTESLSSASSDCHLICVRQVRDILPHCTTGHQRTTNDFGEAVPSSSLEPQPRVFPHSQTKKPHSFPLSFPIHPSPYASRASAQRRISSRPPEPWPLPPRTSSPIYPARSSWPTFPTPTLEPTSRRSLAASSRGTAGTPSSRPLDLPQLFTFI